MASVVALQEQQKESARKIHEILDSAEKEERDVTSEERELLTNAEKEFDTLAAKIAQQQQDDKLSEKLEAFEKEQASRPKANRRTAADLLEDANKDDPEIPDSFPSLAEQLGAVVRAGHPDIRTIDERLKWESINVNAAITGSSESIPSDGGYLLQPTFSSELFKRMYDVGQLLSRARSIEVGPNSNSLCMNYINETSRAGGSRFGGISVTRTPEGGQGTGSRPKLGQLRLTLKKLFGLWYATEELLEDTTAMASVANEAFPEEFAFVTEDELINGDGAAQMQGIMNSNALVTVAAETGQGATKLEYKNLTKMWARMWARSRQNAVWLINQDLESSLMSLEFPVGTGGIPAFLPPGGLSGSPYSTLFGRPVIPVEYCATAGTTGDILLTDWSQYLMITKGALNAASSIHLRFDFAETAFRWLLRNDGQSLWNSALTPANGTDTLSPFVALATRS